MNKRILLIAIIVATCTGSVLLGKVMIDSHFFELANKIDTTNNLYLISMANEIPELPAIKQQPQFAETIAKNLNIPWELVFLPDDEMLVTERPGRLLKIGRDKKSIEIRGVAHVGEGGLLGLALHPNFTQNSFIYLYLTTRTGNSLTNRVERYVLSENKLENRTIIIDNIPGAQIHDGGRLAFGPDEKLYITTGDAGKESDAQDKDNLAGKILRLNDDGSIPNDNPFHTPVWSYGHRNPQGLAWDENRNLWATEHGRSGVTSGLDEINLIEPGKNYGWPKVQGDETSPEMEMPKAHSGSRETWAPSGAIVFEKNLLFTGLRGESLYQSKINGTSLGPVVAQHKNQFGRLRSVVKGPDNFIYLLTNNRDGRGTAMPGDDKIIRIDPIIYGISLPKKEISD